MRSATETHRCPSCGHQAAPGAISPDAWRCDECDTVVPVETPPRGVFHYEVTEVTTYRFASWAKPVEAVA